LTFAFSQVEANLIWIFGDQHRAQAQGHMGDPNLSTPNLDWLAEWIEETGDEFSLPAR